MGNVDEKAKRSAWVWVRTACGVEEPKPADLPLGLVRRAIVIAAALSLPVLTAGLSRFPRVVEFVYADHLGQWIARILSRISRVFPVSIFEVFFWTLILWTLCYAVRGAFHVITGRRRALNAAIGGGLWFLSVAAVVLILFYTNWAIGFARADLIARLHWQDFAKSPEAEAGKQELARLCEALVAETNRDYQQAFGTSDAKEPSVPKLGISMTATMRAMNAAIDAAYVRVADRLKLNPAFGVPRGRAKPILASFMMSKMLTSGFYSPWTGEANYNRQMPACNLAEVIAHEKAHQRGITNEDEANFFGYLVCASSDEPCVRYSGHLMGQRQLLRELQKCDGPAAEALAKKRLPGVQRDVDAIRDFVKSNQGAISNASQTVNNTYLKANRVKAGVMAYELCARLIVAFARSNSGSCLVPNTSIR